MLFCIVTTLIKLLQEWSSSLLEYPQKALNVDDFLVRHLTDLQRYFLAWFGETRVGEVSSESASESSSFPIKLLNYLRLLLTDPTVNLSKRLIRLYLMANTCQILAEMVIFRKFGHAARMKLLTWAELFKYGI